MALAPTSSHGGSGVATVAATDTSIVVAGTATAPTIATGTLDVIAAQHAPAGSVAMNSQKITGLANGTLATDAAAFGQISGAGNLTLLSTTTLGADGVFDVSGISQAYNDLRLVLVARGTRAAATADFLQCQLNNDSTVNAYDGGYLDGATGSGPTPGTSARMSGAMPAASATAGAFGIFDLSLVGYTTSRNPKVLQGVCIQAITKNGSVVIEHSYAVWWNAAAVTRIGFFGGTTANLLAGSTLRIYGVL